MYKTFRIILIQLLLRHGIKIPSCTVGVGYSSNQLVIRQDLQCLWYVLQSVSVSAGSTTISACGDSTTLSLSAAFKLQTKDEGGTSGASSNVSYSETGSYSDNADYTSISGSKITFSKNEASDCASAPSRSTTVTGSYSYSGVSKSNTVTITQSANTIDSTWTTTSTSTYSISISPSSMSFESAGGTKSYTVTRYYTVYQAKYDSCGTKVCSNSYNTSSTVTPSTYTVSNTSFSCTSSSVTVGINSGDDRTGTLTVGYGGFTDTCSLSQGASQAGSSCGDPYDYSYSLTVSTSPTSVGSDATSSTVTARYYTTYKQKCEETNDAGEVTSSWTTSYTSSQVVTNSTTWSADTGSISSGTWSIPTNTSTDSRTLTVKGTYNGYSDTASVSQSGTTSTDTGDTYSCTLYYVNNTTQGGGTVILTYTQTGTSSSNITATLVGESGNLVITASSLTTFCIVSAKDPTNTYTYNATMDDGNNCFTLTKAGSTETITFTDGDAGTTFTPYYEFCIRTASTFTTCDSSVTVSHNSESDQYNIYVRSRYYTGSGDSDYSTVNVSCSTSDDWLIQQPRTQHLAQEMVQ